jgi:leucyl aminopeptidase
MKIEILSSLTTDSKSTTLVIFTSQSKTKSKTQIKSSHKDLLKKYESSVSEKVITGKAHECILFRDAQVGGFKNLLFVGLGDDAQMTSETLREVGSTVHDFLKGHQLKDAFIHFDDLATGKKSAEYFQALVEGTLLSTYNFDELKSKAKDDKETIPDEKEFTLHILTKAAKSKEIQKACTDAHIIAESVNFARRLGDMPGNLMTPAILAETAVEASKGTGIKATVWDKARIKKEKMGGLLGVSMGSSEEPRFIILEYKGGAASKKPVVFVGKGLTFDCGGISIKPSAGMEEMKYDMCGGANVIGTILAIAKLKLKINVTALIASTENMPGPSATKPGDIHTARNGKTFEINNTDAEGRLILADALCYATELKPQVILDAATLTGAMVMALGNIHTGYFTRSKDLKKKVETAAEHSGELVWNMPLCDHHVTDMKGTFADLSNMSSGKGAGSATAAAFLEQFVGSDIPWAHFDIAGTGWHTGGRVKYNPKKGASGVMIRTFIELAKTFA